MKLITNQKGITLVALVVTIIVLLILAGVTISMVLGQQGIFEKAGEASKKTAQQNYTEELELLALETKMEKITEKWTEEEGLTKLEAKIKGSSTLTGAAVSKQEGKIEVGIAGYKYEVTLDGVSYMGNGEVVPPEEPEVPDVPPEVPDVPPEDPNKLTLQGKKVIIIGDRDGVQAEKIEPCVTSAGGTVVYSKTECFVCTAAGAMELDTQEAILNLTEQYGRENIVVILGGAEGESSALAAETVILGDPTFAGALQGVSLNLTVYHIIEPEVKELIDTTIWNEQIASYESTLDVQDIINSMTEIRSQAPTE